MSKETSEVVDEEHGDMRLEYDFAAMKGGVRGRYHSAYRAGHTVKVVGADGTTVEQHFTLEDGAVMLDPGEVR